MKNKNTIFPYDHFREVREAAEKIKVVVTDHWLPSKSCYRLILYLFRKTFKFANIFQILIPASFTGDKNM